MTRTTDLLEELKAAGDAKVYGSNGTGLVADAP